MVKMSPLILVFAFFFTECGTFSERARLESFSEISTAYQKALQRADYKTAYRYLDPATVGKEVDLKRYKNIKVVEYETSNIRVSEDHTEINLDVEISYHYLNDPILKTITDKQFWKYKEEEKGWMIQTGLPDFN